MAASGPTFKRPPARRRPAPEKRSSSEDFQNVRIFVQNIPEGVSWEDLKKHFKVAGTVVYASISVDENGRSKGQGIVQFETVAEADKAIKIMRDHPLNGQRLYVRADRQERGQRDARRRADGETRSATASASVAAATKIPNIKWRRAPRDTADDGSEADLKRAAEVANALSAREAYRSRREFAKADLLWDKLVSEGVKFDSSHHMWWIGPLKRTWGKESKEKEESSV